MRRAIRLAATVYLDITVLDVRLALPATMAILKCTAITVNHANALAILTPIKLVHVIVSLVSVYNV